jgi:hypothetical protein
LCQLRLSATTFRNECAQSDCRFDAHYGTVRRTSLPAKAVLEVRFLRADGTRVREAGLITIPAVAGASAARITLPSVSGITGRRLLEIRGVVRGRHVVRRILVTVRSTG